MKSILGPMTIIDCIKDQFYGEEKKRDLIEDLIGVINQEILSLAKHGCKFIQVDEPVLMRYPDQALQFGITDVAKCFQGNIKNRWKIGLKMATKNPLKLVKNALKLALKVNL